MHHGKKGTEKADRRAKDNRYYEKNKEEIKRKNRERQRLARKVKKQKQIQEDLPPSSPLRSSCEPSPRRPRTIHEPKPTACHPKRTRRDSIDSMVDGMFDAGEEYDDAHVVRDHSPLPPTLPSVACAVKQITAATTGTQFVSEDVVANWTVLRTTRLAVEQWIQPLGPVSGWAKKFRECYDTACQTDGNTQEEVDRFLASVQAHVNIGRQILGELSKSPIIRPQESTDAWADWLIAGDLLATLHRGIAILEAHLDIIAPHCPIPSDSTSGVRQWAGFASLL